MSDLLDFYQQQAKQDLVSPSWLMSRQEQALADFTRLGFPTRDQEEWRYTPTDSFLQHAFTRAMPSEHLNHHAMEVVAAGRQVDAPIGLKIAIVDGVVLGLEAIQAALPPGVVVQPLRQAIVEHPEKIEPYLGKVLSHHHAFQALNTAMIELGLFIFVPKHIVLPEPLLLTHWQTAADQALFIRHVIVAESGSALSLIEDFQGESKACYFTNTVTEVHLHPAAALTHYKIQRESPVAFHVGHLAVTQDATSQFKSHVLSLGAQWSRSDMTVQLKESNGRCFLNGIYVPRHQQCMGHNTLIQHLVKASESEQDYKGIVSDQARAMFQGKIVVSPEAIGTKAKQQNKNILLSTGAEIDTKPQLDIYADDVQCTHGATVGQLDEDALFYLTTRGIDQAEARRYLIQAFAASNLQALDHDPMKTWMATLLNQKIG